ncbi:hypothetical protein SAMN05519104_8076 [Rhizobiales bacterium GAS188]|nr:hypothetical protein SAMN05519104_8076 [Rhizobiales bacterium GAS188]
MTSSNKLEHRSGECRSRQGKRAHYPFADAPIRPPPGRWARTLIRRAVDFQPNGNHAPPPPFHMKRGIGKRTVYVVNDDPLLRIQSVCPHHGNVENRTICVVKDDPFLRLESVCLLEEAGFPVAGFASPERALAYVGHHAEEICLLVTELSYPSELTGLQLARRVAAKWPWIRSQRFRIRARTAKSPRSSSSPRGPGCRRSCSLTRSKRAAGKRNVERWRISRAVADQRRGRAHREADLPSDDHTGFRAGLRNHSAPARPDYRQPLRTRPGL